MAATWSYLASQVLAETLTADVRRVTVSPQAEVTGRASGNILRGFRARYTTVTTAEANSMTAFFHAQQGPFLPFGFAFDTQSYQVRFDSTMKPALFQADKLASGGDVLFVVVTS